MDNFSEESDSTKVLELGGVMNSDENIFISQFFTSNMPM